MYFRQWLASICMALLWMLQSIDLANADDAWTPEITDSSFPLVNNILQFEDSTKTILITDDTLYFSENSGKEWNKLDLKDNDGNDLKPLTIQEFPYIPNAAMVFTSSGRVMYTLDKASSWKYVDFPVKNVVAASAQINFANPDYMLFQFKYHEKFTLFENTYYSKDGLKTDPVEISMDNTGECSFTKINPDFTQGSDAAIVCIQREYNQFNILKSDKVIVTDDFFNSYLTSEGNGLENSHVLSLKIVNSFIVLIVSTDRYLIDSTVLYISKDAKSFDRAFFEGQEKGAMFSILDSTPNALYVAVYGRHSKHGMSSSDIFRSDSDGRYFKKIFGDVLSNMLGMSLISKVQTLDGVWIASHNEDYPNSKSMITFDDGANWTYLNITDAPNCNNDKECSLNIAWLTQRTGGGDIASGETPGILIGVGNVGKYLEHNVEKLKTFLSRDGGLSWKKVSDSPTVFAFGDLGNILVTVPVNLEHFLSGSKEKAADSLSFSLNQGETWSDVKLSSKMIPYFFVNSKDNTDKTFILFGKNVDKNDAFVSTIDFSSAFTTVCGESDMEEWFARVDPLTGKQVCVYGHSEKFNRRKIDAKCFVDKKYDDLKVIEKPCQCTIGDSECNYGFQIDENNVCQPILPMLSQFCEAEKKSKITLSSRRIIPGNLCEGGYQPSVGDYTLNCKNANNEKKLNEIQVKYTSFKEHIRYYKYLEKNSTQVEFQDETLIVLTASRKAYISFDGISFDLIDAESVLYIFTNPFWPDSVYLISDTGDITTSLDRGYTFQTYKSPHTSTGYSSYNMIFDIKSPNVHILFSNINCDASNNCEVYASLTEDNGNSYIDLPQNINKCVFAESLFDSENYNFPDTEIICTQKVEGQSYYRLISTTDAFLTETNVLFEKVIGFGTSGKYMVVAELVDEGLAGYVTLDGKNFAKIQFPADVSVEQQTAYTILDVSSQELFIHLTTYDVANHEFGALLKANYNGTLLTTALNYVNRNADAFVDFESIQTLEGLQLANVLMNPADVINGADKKLVTKISHNDGATWSTLPFPNRDSDGNLISCKACSLHLHSYTDRTDALRDTPSSPSAIGLMFGLGNIGTNLTPMNDESLSLYFSKDGGINWKEVAKGNYMWEFGDQGTVLVVVQRSIEVDTLKYSLDFGETWLDYKFSPDKKYVVEDIATVPSDNSLKFILIVKDEGSSHSIFSIDFTGVYPRQCALPLDTVDDIGDDFEYFTPKHPSLKDSCLFGHETKYLRRKSKKECFIGMAPLSLGSKVVKNCECSREDYECDYNYELANDGTCKLVKGLTGKKGDEVCYNSNAEEWWEPTGYRRLEHTTCENGLVLDKWISHPCPGKQLDKDKISGLSMFMIIFVPLVVFATSIFVIYERGIRRNGGFSRLGEIRLDEDDNLQLIEQNQLDKVINTIIRFGVFSFQGMGKFTRFASKFFNRLTNRSVRHEHVGSMGAFFNDMVDDDHSLFGDLNDDEDAREIDSFLERSNNDEFGDFATHDSTDSGYRDDLDVPEEVEDGPVDADNSEFRLSDNENDD